MDAEQKGDSESAFEVSFDGAKQQI